MPLLRTSLPARSQLHPLRAFYATPSPSLPPYPTISRLLALPAPHHPWCLYCTKKLPGAPLN